MQVDFYILETGNAQQSLFYACQLIEKAYQDQQKVYIHANSKEEAERLDNLLWTYKEDSFLPHQIYQETDFPPPIQIGTGNPPSDQQDLLINLNHLIPNFYTQFKRVIEIVFADPQVQQLARERFKQYRDQGCLMNTFKIKS